MIFLFNLIGTTACAANLENARTVLGHLTWATLLGVDFALTLLQLINSAHT